MGDRKDINSDIISTTLKEKNKQSYYVPDRNNLFEEFKKYATHGTVILLMGARDTTLAEFARNVLKYIKEN
ncbi:MAG: hypothetical protein SNJ71_02395, partial [Bacteroidales bacterium]